MTKAEDKCGRKTFDCIQDLKGRLIININCRSVADKLDDLKELVYDLQPLLVVLTETWLNESHPKGLLNIKGYKSYRNDRTEDFKQRYQKTGGGGIALLHREDLKVTQIRQNDMDLEEAAWYSFKIMNEKYILGTLYKPEYVDILEGNPSKLERSLTKAAQLANRVLLAGDFNINLLEESTATRHLNEVCETIGLKQQINTPTRISDTSGTLLDHIWATSDCRVGKSGVLPGISDHLIAYVEITSPPKQEDRQITCRTYKNYNSKTAQDLYTDLLEKSNFRTHLEEQHINEATDEWIRVVQEVCEKTAPIKTFTIKNEEQRVPWFNAEVSHLKNVRESLLKIYHKNNDPHVKDKLRQLTNTLRSLKRRLKRSYYAKQIEEKENDAKKLWDLLREATNTKEQRQDTEPDNANTQTANEFNTYFANVGRSVQQKLGMEETNYSVDQESYGFNFTMETADNVSKMIQDLKRTVATGSCQIPARILKDLCDVVKDDLSDLINLSYRTNTFPRAMKHAYIKAVYKNKGTTDKPEFYRPISILPVVSKLFEKSATRQLVSYLENNQGLYAGQHTYRRGHSTTTCLIEITEAIHKELERGGVIGIASMDLSKAFDSVSHSLLLGKLAKKGLGGGCLRWLETYLTERTQQVKFKEATSEIETVRSGVPQGSVLGPILFIAFTADLVDHLENDCIVKAYADDTQLMIGGKTRQEVKKRLEQAISKAQQWFGKNSLLINPTKTEIMMLGKKQPEESADLTIDVREGETIIPLKLAPHIKILGVTLDEELNWKKHVKQVRRNATNIIRNLARASGVLPQRAKRTLYDSLVAPHFSYADVVWDGCLKEQQEALQRSHNFAARVITGASKYSSATQALKNLGMVPRSEKRRMHQAVLARKLIDGNGPSELCARFENIRKNVNQEETIANRLRSKSRMVIQPQQHKSARFERSTIHRMSKAWNRVSLKTKQIETPSKFKAEVQRELTRAYWGPSISLSRP